eukprot:scaffold61089_cov59-Attheya_sp.AAC.3
MDLLQNGVWEIGVDAIDGCRSGDHLGIAKRGFTRPVDSYRSMLKRSRRYLTNIVHSFNTSVNNEGPLFGMRWGSNCVSA